MDKKNLAFLGLLGLLFTGIIVWNIYYATSRNNSPLEKIDSSTSASNSPQILKESSNDTSKNNAIDQPTVSPEARLDFLSYKDEDLDVSFFYKDSWKIVKVDGAIDIHIPPEETSSWGEYLRSGLSVKRVENSLEKFIEHIKGEQINTQVKTTVTSFRIDGQNAQKIVVESNSGPDDSLVQDFYIFVPRLTDAIAISYDESIKLHQEFISKIKILEDEWYTIQPLGQEQKRVLLHNKNEQNICKQLPYPTDTGRVIYPIDPKYTVAFFGELFTAADCNNGSINNLFGVDNGMYTLGSSLTLKGKPSKELLQVFLDIGFQCEQNTTPENCTEWTLQDFSVLIKDILKLQPFHGQFQKNDCRNCG